jgi:REP element-mobilizing transposase RayT
MEVNMNPLIGNWPMKKFKNKYRIPPARAQWWNYANQGAYFITICTAGHKYFFGDIINNEMLLSNIGIIVQEEWEKSFQIRSELFCDAFVIMPNHIHGIVRIDKTESDNAITIPPPSHGVAYRPPGSVSSFVAGFKSSATKKINEYRNTPGKAVWQTRFYDHIIRNHDEYLFIRKYIETNIINWTDDTLYGKKE